MKETVVEHAASTPADLRRVGSAILIAGLIIGVIAARFLIGEGPRDPKDMNAGIMFAIVAAIISTVGVLIVITAPRRGQKPSAPTDESSLPTPPAP